MQLLERPLKKPPSDGPFPLVSSVNAYPRVAELFLVRDRAKLTLGKTGVRNPPPRLRQFRAGQFRATFRAKIPAAGRTDGREKFFRGKFFAIQKNVEKFFEKILGPEIFRPQVGHLEKTNPKTQLLRNP